MVHTLDEKACAERAVKNIKGVRAIADDIEVKLPAQMRKADEHIAEQISRLLTWYSSLRNMDVRAEVDDGHVTLTGEVDFLYQKSLAAERVAELESVAGISEPDNDPRTSRDRPERGQATDHGGVASPRCSGSVRYPYFCRRQGKSSSKASWTRVASAI